MKRTKTNIGEKRGILTVKSKEQIRVKNGTTTYLNCVCDCGNIKRIKNSHFKSLPFPNCGCISKKLQWDKRTENGTRNPEHNGIKYIGERYNYLEFIKYIPSGKTPKYLCRCDCGNEKILRYDHVVSGNTKSCGCKKIEMTREASKIPFGKAAFNSLYNSYRNSAKQRGFNFELTKDEFANLVSQHCSYCGIPPLQQHTPKKYNGGYIYNGIDRIDSNIGYKSENCVPCCSRCNYMKRSYTIEDFKTHIERIYNHLFNI